MTGVGKYSAGWYEMPRKKRVVEGLVLDLSDLEGESVDIDSLLAAAEAKKEKKPAKPVPVTKTDEEILENIYTGHHCSVCRRSIFTPVKLWKGEKVCLNCHKHCRKTGISHELSEYVRGVYKRGCSFCNIKAGRFHLDHINMFNKVNSVYSLLEVGAAAEDIIAEIEKCQLLCVNCHGLVTKYEARRGFLNKKRGLNRKIKNGEDVTELRQQLYAEYEGVMNKMYPLIREKATYIWPEDDIIEHIDSSIDDVDSVVGWDEGDCDGENSDSSDRSDEK